ncbi:MAG: amidotransferase [Desulfobacterales bacterium RIFOXYA12_FULL_46_15]|nr:MAG: amidotransferase [Desulfobacula sp. GWF2_41_7]OGR22583.1 MAG: amidotransferase [Desulfobacterales bacterium RIFOXYA12_FULL_46_15]
MRVHYLQHVPFEGIGSMATYFENKGHKPGSTLLYEGQALPDPQSIDFLIVMGGPMGVHDDLQYPWMKKEKAFIRACMDQGKIVLGICLGAQLIADVLEARVYKNKNREIGWFPLTISDETRDTVFKDVFQDRIEVFHWHGDTFDIPESAVRIASSPACLNQGFIMDNRIVGFQFHLETTPESAGALIKNCGHELDESPFVQSEKELTAHEERFTRINEIMTAVLERLVRQSA